METAKIFNNGGSQAVRLPKDCRFNETEVVANRIGGIVILMPKTASWEGMKQGVKMFSDDFLSENVSDLPLEERENL